MLEDNGFVVQTMSKSTLANISKHGSDRLQRWQQPRHVAFDRERKQSAEVHQPLLDRCYVAQDPGDRQGLDLGWQRRKRLLHT